MIHILKQVRNTNCKLTKCYQFNPFGRLLKKNLTAFYDMKGIFVRNFKFRLETKNYVMHVDLCVRPG